MKKKLLTFALIPIILLLGAWACNQQTNVQLWTTAGKLIDSWLAVYAHGWGSQQQFDTAWAAAGQDILNWQPGTPCQNTQQAINDALGIIATVPTPDPKAALILATAVVGAEVVETFFVKCSGTMMASHYPPALQKAVNVQRKAPPKDAAELKKQWKDVGGPQ